MLGKSAGAIRTLVSRVSRRRTEVAAAHLLACTCTPLQTPRRLSRQDFLRRFSNASQQKSQDQSSAGGESESQINLKALGLLTLAASGIGAYFNIRRYQREVAKEQAAGTTVEREALGRPNLGGDFKLINQDGLLTSNEDFLGKWMYIYFGFTYCPDICPNELMRMQEVLTKLEKDFKIGSQIVPIFITIDPERDGPKQLKDYLSDWHRNLIGLTGSPEQIDEVCKKYRVYYSKAQLGNDPTDYLIDHSVMFYLVDPQGNFVDYYGQNMSVEEMHAKMVKSMKSFRG